MAEKNPKPQALREAFDLELSTGNASLRLPARMTWEDRRRLKSLIDLIPDPPRPIEGPPTIIQEEIDSGGGISE